VRLFEMVFLIFFIVVLLLSVIFSIVLNLTNIALTLLVVDFFVAAVVAVYGSLSIREEEEEIS
jgi:hypothetical protein